MTKPKINPPLRKVDIIIEAMAGICLLYMIVQLIIVYPDLSQQVPTHFGRSGSPDAWGDKSSLLIMPIVTIILYAGLTVLNYFPYLFNYPIGITAENAQRQYQYAKSLLTTLKFTTTGLFLYIQLQTISVAKEIQSGLGTYFLVIVVIGSFIPIVIYFVIAAKNK
jgi:uncharacterized membrane protein